MIKAVIFDFDGVLAESVDIKTEAFAKLFASEGPPIVEKIVNFHLAHAGVSRFEKFKYIYNEILKKPLTEEASRDLSRRFSLLVANEVVKAPYVIGAQSFLENYSKQYKYFVMSATPQDELIDIIRKRGLSKYFIAVYGLPETKHNAVKKIILEYCLSPAEIVYVGDALSDYEAAVHNHVNFIARINNNEQIFKEVDCFKLKDLTYLENIIATIDKQTDNV